MSKLIQLQVLEAKNVICGSVVSPMNKTDDFWENIDKDTAKRDYTVPSHIIVGVFDDGSTRVAGIENLNVLNRDMDEDDLDGSYNYDYGIFYYDTIISEVGLAEVKAFARYYQDTDGTIHKNVKAQIYEDLLRSGVKIDEEAKDYLLT